MPEGSGISRTRYFGMWGYSSTDWKSLLWGILTPCSQGLLPSEDTRGFISGAFEPERFQVQWPQSRQKGKCWWGGGLSSTQRLPRKTTAFPGVTPRAHSQLSSRGVTSGLITSGLGKQQGTGAQLGNLTAPEKRPATSREVRGPPVIQQLSAPLQAGDAYSQLLRGNRERQPVR